MKLWLAAAAFGSALLVAAPVFAQEASSAPDIVVTADRLQEVVRSFVGDISAASNSEDRLARWDRRICPGLIGIRDRDQAQYMVDRISQRAFEVGLEAGRPGCQANVLIFVTQNSGQLAQVIADQYHAYIGYNAHEGAVTQGHEALSRFVESDQPVRWWHVSQTVSADGQVLGESQTQMSRSGGFRGAQVVRQNDPGRLRASTRQDFNRVIIIVDAQRAAGKQFSALADYVAMAALAQLEPGADTSRYATVLSLFAPGDTTSTMTEWDLAYLRGLYDAPRAARNARQQEGAISRTMREGLWDGQDD
jgi:hypothetical protein